MKKFKIILSILISVLAVSSVVYAIQISPEKLQQLTGENLGASVFNSAQVGTNPVNGYYLKTNGTTSSWEAGSGGGDWVQETNYGVANLTASTTIPVWFKDAVYASSTLQVAGKAGSDSFTVGSSTVTQLIVKDTGRIGIGTSTPSAYLDIQGGNLPTFSAEMTTNGGFDSDLSGWAISGTGTGWEWSAGTAYHDNSPTNIDVLSQTITVVSGTTYLIVVDISERTSGYFYVSIGGTATSTILGSVGTKNIALTATASGDASLAITPYSANRFNGKINSISVKSIITPSDPTLKVSDDNGATAFELRTGDASLGNIFLGTGSGRVNSTGYSNFALGYNSLYSNLTGYENTAVGSNSMYSNTVGFTNLAFGSNTLYSNTSGYGNLAFGGNALYSNTTGQTNTAIGNWALEDNTTGYENIAIGSNALTNNTSGNSNISIGEGSSYSILTGTANTAIGWNAMYLGTTNEYNVAIGYQAAYYTTSDNNVVIGANALQWNEGGTGNTVIGTDAMHQVWTTSSNNTAVGYMSGYGNATGYSNSNNSLFGYKAGYALRTGSNNILMGYQAGDALTTGSNNIIIGYDQDALAVSTSNFLNIGGVIYGNLNNKTLGIGTTTPAGLLNVASTLPKFYISDTDATTDNKHWFLENNAGALSFGTTTDSLAVSGTRAMTILNNGNVGIGTTTPAYKFEVYGNSMIKSDTATTTMEGLSKICNKGCTQGVYFTYPSTVTSTMNFFYP